MCFHVFVFAFRWPTCRHRLTVGPDALHPGPYQSRRRPPSSPLRSPLNLKVMVVMDTAVWCGLLWAGGVQPAVTESSVGDVNSAGALVDEGPSTASSPVSSRWLPGKHRLQFKNWTERIFWENELYWITDSVIFQFRWVRQWAAAGEPGWSFVPCESTDANHSLKTKCTLNDSFESNLFATDSVHRKEPFCPSLPNHPTRT